VSSIDIPGCLLSTASQTYVEKSKVPLLINSCEFDPLFPPELRTATDEKFANFAPGYRRTYWEGAHHGFAARGDPVCVFFPPRFDILVLILHPRVQNDPPMKAAKEGSFKASVEWLRKYME
jgi:dienelactone hydrolase